MVASGLAYAAGVGIGLAVPTLMAGPIIATLGLGGALYGALVMLGQ